MLEGEFEHEDSAAIAACFARRRAMDDAGAGIVHSEMPRATSARKAAECTDSDLGELPAKLKMSGRATGGFREQIPEGLSEDGRAACA